MGETSEKNGTMNWVDMDNLQGGVKAVEHLLKCGYRKIAYVADDLEAMFTNEGSRVMRKLWREKIPVLFLRKRMKKNWKEKL